jgi:hypothetical protein
LPIIQVLTRRSDEAERLPDGKRQKPKGSESSGLKSRRPQAPRARHVLLSVGPRRSARVQARPRSRPRQACDLAGHLTRGFRLSRKFIVLVLEVSTLRTPSCGGPPPAESAAIAENFLGRLRECFGASSEPRVRAMVAKQHRLERHWLLLGSRSRPAAAASAPALHGRVAFAARPAGPSSLGDGLDRRLDEGEPQCCGRGSRRRAPCH